MQGRGFDKVGLHFVYNPYEIACGAIGAVEVLIDLKVNPCRDGDAGERQRMEILAPERWPSRIFAH